MAGCLSVSATLSLSCSLLLTDTEHLSVLLGGEKSDDSVGSHSEVVGGETGPEASHALLGQRLLQAVGDILVRHLTVSISLLLLHLRLEVVEGQGTESGSNGSQHRATELDLQRRGIWAHSFCGGILGRLVGDKHGDVKCTSSHHGGDCTPPEGSDSLLGDNAGERIKDVLVVAALSLGQGSVSLHSHKGQIARVANEGTKGASEEGATSTLQGAQVLTTVLVDLNPLGQVEVDTETESTVDDLSEQG